MAPRRGGGGSFGGGSGSPAGCPGAFQSDAYFGVWSTLVEVFTAHVLFLTTLLGLLLYRCCTKKPHAKKLVGPLWWGAVASMTFGTAMFVIGIVLLECRATPTDSYNAWVIVYYIFSYLAQFLLLASVVSAPTTVLHEQLGSAPKHLRLASYVTLGFIGLLTLALAGLMSYNTYAFGWGSIKLETYGEEALKLEIAYYVFYLLAVLGAGAFAIKAAFSMRSRNLAMDNIVAKVITLYFAMFIWVLFILIWDGSRLPDAEGFESNVYIGFQYVVYFFTALSWIMLVVLAKSPSIKSRSTDAAPTGYDGQPYYGPVTIVQQMPPGQQPGYQMPPQQYMQNGQQYYYQQQPIPVYANTTSPVNGNGNPNVVQVK